MSPYANRKLGSDRTKTSLGCTIHHIKQPYQGFKSFPLTVSEKSLKKVRTNVGTYVRTKRTWVKFKAPTSRRRGIKICTWICLIKKIFNYKPPSQMEWDVGIYRLSSFIFMKLFLAHLAEGNVSYCHHFASVVRPSSNVKFFQKSSPLKLLNWFSWNFSGMFLNVLALKFVFF